LIGQLFLYVTRALFEPLHSVDYLGFVYIYLVWAVSFPCGWYTVLNSVTENLSIWCLWYAHISWTSCAMWPYYVHVCGFCLLCCYC